MVEDYRVHSRATTNIGHRSFFLELEDKYDEEGVEYFKVKEYSRPNHTTFNGSANWIPFKEIFL